MQSLVQAVEGIPRYARFGRVARVEGLLVEVTGAQGAIGLGGRVRIANADMPEMPCEVVGFREGRALAMPFGRLEGISLGARATFDDSNSAIFPSKEWLGRVVDAFGRPADGLGAMASGDGASLMWRMEDLFAQALTILNTKDGNSFTYAGENDQTPPITVSTLAELAALPLVDDAFANGSIERSARIGENRTIQVGLLASDIGTELFTLFRDVAQFNASVSGPFGPITNTTQDNFLQSKIPEAVLAHSNATAITAANGDRYRLVNSAMEELRSTATVYKGFASNIEDVDMGEAIARLQQSQLALQAAYQVSSTVGQLSLLDYLGP